MSSSESPPRVLIVDDSPFIRMVLKDMLVKDQGIEVIGTAADGVEALQKVDEFSPDVLTLDIEMPRMNGIEVLKHLIERSHPPRVMMLSSLTSTGAEMTRRALQLGADDFMLKPREIASVKGIELELVTKIKQLITIPQVSRQIQKPNGLARKVVLIGSSAGGPAMLDVLVSSLSPTLHAAVVITQHMPLGFTAPLAERLNKVSLLPVCESQNGSLIEEGKIMVSKAGYHTVISGAISDTGVRGGKILHTTDPPLHSVRPSVDTTFCSGARTYGSRTVAIILSGMGHDGGEGARIVRNAGGYTMVCAEKDCLVYGMARAAREREAVDKVVSLNSMSAEIENAVARAGGCA